METGCRKKNSTTTWLHLSGGRRGTTGLSPAEPIPSSPKCLEIVDVSVTVQFKVIMIIIIYSANITSTSEMVSLFSFRYVDKKVLQTGLSVSS